MTQLTLYAPLTRLQRTATPPSAQLSPLTKSDIPALSSLYLLAYDSVEVAADIAEARQEMELSFAGEYGEVAHQALQSGYETVGLRVDTLAAADATRLYQRLGFTPV